ncbi:hypothetical protein CXB51_014170 [Gossypium anomalum]|uniref:CCHC-type domain-containing protein n=1 Tax=Gossypium anomalum TaxID=47600 RepID=A0A8J6D2F6_9ROSI|nr:hypothetical protein CXB51_014170 [Gossypium anomalum]
MVLTQGSSVVFGHYLTVQPWVVDFNLLWLFPSVVLVWIYFTGMLGFLYKRQLLEEIGSLVGKVAQLDIKTYIDTKGRFPRMVVFVDLDKPLVSQILVNRRVQMVEFESLLAVCFSCGCYGHLKELCPSIVPDQNFDGGKVKAPISIVKGSALVDVEKPFGQWMVVERKSW